MSLRIMGLIITVFSFSPAYAEETDFIHDRNLPDTSGFLDQKMNIALEKIANESRNCKPSALHHAILDQLGGWGWSEIEDWVFEDPNHGKVVRKKNSIYNGLPGSIWGCCSPSVNYQGNIISGDKLGHFLHSGFEMWAFARNVTGKKTRDQRGLFSKTFDLFAYTTSSSFHRLYQNIESYRTVGIPAWNETEWAVALSLAQEEGWWGLLGTGIKSYADMASNIEGYHFWSDLTEGPNPYYQCVNKKWKLVRNFTWSSYVSAAWDEGVNCSSYAHPNNAKTLQGYCPVKASACFEIQERYRDFPELISPTCQ